MPNNVNIDFKNIFYKKLENLNQSLLLKDLKELYKDKNFPEIFNKNCKIIFIKSENDFILHKNASNNFFVLLKKLFGKNLIEINLPNQGHCITNLNLYEIINNALCN